MVTEDATVPDATPVRDQIALSWRTSTEICYVVHAQACCDLSQAFSTCGEESAQQAAAVEFLKPGLPVFGAGAQAFEDSR